MLDLLLQIAFNNTCFALAIGGVAMVVGAQGKPVLFIKQVRPYPGMRQPW